MDYQEYARLLVSIVSFLALFAALSVWRCVFNEWIRHKAFSIRARLFDAAHKSGALNDPAYKDTRLMINGLLREIHTLTIWKGLYIAFVWARNRKIREMAPAEISPITNEIKHARNDVKRLIIYHLWMSRLDGFVIMLLLASLGKFHRLIQAYVDEVNKVGSDDRYARSKTNGWHLAEA